MIVLELSSKISFKREDMYRGEFYKKRNGIFEMWKEARNDYFRQQKERGE